MFLRELSGDKVTIKKINLPSPFEKPISKSENLFEDSWVKPIRYYDKIPTVRIRVIIFILGHSD